MQERGEIPIQQLKKAGFTADDLLPTGRKFKKGDSSLKLISGWRHSRPDLDNITNFNSGKDIKKLKKARQSQNDKAYYKKKIAHRKQSSGMRSASSAAGAASAYNL